MPKDGITPDHPLPVFLSDAEEGEQPGIWRGWQTTIVSTQLLKTSILGVAAAAIVFAMLWVGNPLVLFANAPALLADLSAPKPGTDQSTSTIQPTAGTQALPPTASEAPTADETTAAFKTAYQNQTEIRQPDAESLLNRFQAWAAEEDARTQATAAQPQPMQEARSQPVQEADPQPAQDAEPQPAPDDEPQVRHVRKHRQVRHVQNARAEIQAEQNLRRKQNARGPVRPVQDARTQDRPAQDRPAPDTQAPSLWQSLGLRN